MLFIFLLSYPKPKSFQVAIQEVLHDPILSQNLIWNPLFIQLLLRILLHPLHLRLLFGLCVLSTVIFLRLFQRIIFHFYVDIALGELLAIWFFINWLRLLLLILDSFWARNWVSQRFLLRGFAYILLEPFFVHFGSLDQLIIETFSGSPASFIQYLRYLFVDVVPRLNPLLFQFVDQGFLFWLFADRHLHQLLILWNVQCALLAITIIFDLHQFYLMEICFCFGIGFGEDASLTFFDPLYFVLDSLILLVAFPWDKLELLYRKTVFIAFVNHPAVFWILQAQDHVFILEYLKIVLEFRRILEAFIELTVYQTQPMALCQILI